MWYHFLVASIVISQPQVDFDEFLELFRRPESGWRQNAAALINPVTDWGAVRNGRSLRPEDISKSVPYLIDMLNDPEQFPRICAAEAVARGAPATAPALPSLLLASEGITFYPGVVQYAAEQVGAAADSQVPEILARCGHCRETLPVLAKIGTPAAVKAMVELMNRPQDPPAENVPPFLSMAHQVRQHTINLWAEMGEKAAPAVPALVEMLQDSPEAMLQMQICRALTNIGPPAKSSLPILEDWLKQRKWPSLPHGESGLSIVVNAILAIEPASCETLMSFEHEDVRVASIEALSVVRTLPDNVTPLLLSLLEDESAQVRCHAAAAVDRLGNHADVTISTWIKLLDEADSEIVQVAIRSLAALGPQASEALPELQALATSLKPNALFTGSNLIAKQAQTAFDIIRTDSGLSDQQDRRVRSVIVKGTFQGFSADRWVVTVHEGDLCIWDWQRSDSAREPIVLARQIESVVLSPDRQWLFALPRSGKASVWNLAESDPKESRRDFLEAEIIDREIRDVSGGISRPVKFSSGSQFLRHRGRIQNLHCPDLADIATTIYVPFEMFFSPTDRWAVSWAAAGKEQVTEHGESLAMLTPRLHDIRAALMPLQSSSTILPCIELRDQLFSLFSALRVVNFSEFPVAERVEGAICEDRKAAVSFS